MHSHTRGLTARVAKLALAAGLCLCAGQLVSEVPAAASTTTTQAVQPRVAVAASTRNLSSAPAATLAFQARSSRVLARARALTGRPYVFGAAGPRAFDCSGLTQYVYRTAAGVRLPHKANAQQRYGRAVAKRNMRPGDLIIIRSGSYGYHAGIYAGGGYMYDAPRPGATVGKHRIWSRNYVVRRLV